MTPPATNRDLPVHPACGVRVDLSLAPIDRQIGRADRIARPMAHVDERDTPGHLDAIESDPVRMGWMVGSPPPPDKLILFADSSFARFPCTRWSVLEHAPVHADERGAARRSTGSAAATRRAHRSRRRLVRPARPAFAHGLVTLRRGRQRHHDLGRVAPRQLHGRHPHPAPRPHRLRAVLRGARRSHPAHCLLGHQVVRRDHSRDARARRHPRRARHGVAVPARAGCRPGTPMRRSGICST